MLGRQCASKRRLCGERRRLSGENALTAVAGGAGTVRKQWSGPFSSPRKDYWRKGWPEHPGASGWCLCRGEWKRLSGKDGMLVYPGLSGESVACGGTQCGFQAGVAGNDWAGKMGRADPGNPCEKGWFHTDQSRHGTRHKGRSDDSGDPAEQRYYLPGLWLWKAHGRKAPPAPCKAEHWRDHGSGTLCRRQCEVGPGATGKYLEWADLLRLLYRVEAGCGGSYVLWADASLPDHERNWRRGKRGRPQNL